MLPCGKRGVLAELHAGRSAWSAERLERGADVAAEIELRHALAERGERRLVGLDRDVVGALHQRDLGRRLDHAAAGGHRRREHELDSRRRGPQPIGDEEANALLDADFAGRDAAVLQDAGDDRAPVLVFLPHAHVVGELGDLARAHFLEPGRRRRRARPSPG